jgi:glycogen synthase
MKILFLSNFYPPYKIGGYELLCQEVVEALKDRGHSSVVLTSTLGVKSKISEGNIHRFLTLESDLDYYRFKQALAYPHAKKQNIEHMRQLVSEFQPDIIFVWGMWSLSKEVATEAEKLCKSRVVYYLANPWPIEANLHQAYWDMPARKSHRRLLKQMIRIPARIWLGAEWKKPHLRFQFAPCCSKALRDQLVSKGVPIDKAPIIYEGINLFKYSLFERLRDHPDQNGKLSILYVGILAPHKGVHTAIEAIAHLSQFEQQKVTLTILGTGHPDYETMLHNLVDTHHLQQIVKFHNPIPRSDLPEYLSRFDILVLPSIWEEPLALIMQEGLASGMVVIGSSTGGTKEIITDCQNGFLFPPSDFQELAKKIELLLANPSMIREISEKGKQTAFEKFNFVRMVDEMEELLVKVSQINPND